MVDKSGMNISGMKTTVKQLESIVKQYKAIMDKFADDLIKIQTTGEGGQPVWNGTRAKKWITKAITNCYKTDADCLAYLDTLCAKYNKHIKNYSHADGGSSSSSSKVSSSSSTAGDSINTYDLTTK